MGGENVRIGAVRAKPRNAFTLKGGIVFLIVLLICFPGYPLVAASAALVGIPSTPISLGMRAVNAGLALILIIAGLTSKRSRSSDRILFFLFMFWAAYIIRICNDTLLSPEITSNEWHYYWIWAIGGCLLPMLALALAPKTYRSSKFYFKYFYTFTFISGAFAILSASGIAESSTGMLVETGRLRIEGALNPISLGHLGGMLAMQSLWAIFFLKNEKLWPHKLVLIAGMAIGIYLLIAANSRGPIVSATVCMILIITFSDSKRKVGLIALSAILPFVIAPVISFLKRERGIDFLSRFFGSSLSEATEQSQRLALFSSAIDGMKKNPWIGSAMEDPAFGSYPHNIIIESLMSLGVFITIILIVAIILLFIRSIKIFYRAPQYGWASLLFVQYLLGAQFSGSLYNSTYLWCSIGLLISIYPPLAARAHFGKREEIYSMVRHHYTHGPVG